MDYNFEVPRPRKEVLGIRLDAVIEMALFFALLLVIDAAFFEGHRFWGVKPHPFWMIILIMTVFYGTAEGLVAAALASVALLLFNLPAPQFDEDPFSYLLHIALTPMLWLATATIIGGFHDMRVGTISRVRNLYNEAKERENAITAAYSKVEALARNLERQLVGDLSGQMGVYKAASQINATDGDLAEKAALELFHNAMGAEKLSLYLLDGQKLVLEQSQGWTSADTFAQTINASTDLFKAVVGQGQVVGVNTPQGGKALGGEGVLAGPLMHNQTGEIVGMVKIEQLPFTQLSATTIALFDTLCKWVGTQVVNQLHLTRSQANQISDHGVYTSNLLNRDAELLSGLARRMGFELASIEIGIKGGKAISDDDRMALSADLLQAVKKVLRRTDILFLSGEQNTKFTLMIPGADHGGSQIVVDKIQKEIGNKIKDLNFKVNQMVEEKDFSEFAKKPAKKSPKK